MVDIEAVHFGQSAHTSPGALKKLQDLTRKLTKFGGNIQFIEVPFYRDSREIQGWALLAYNLMTDSSLYDANTRPIQRSGAVNINGESLGQVVSQTIESMQAINAKIQYTGYPSSRDHGQAGNH